MSGRTQRPARPHNRNTTSTRAGPPRELPAPRGSAVIAHKAPTSRLGAGPAAKRGSRTRIWTQAPAPVPGSPVPPAAGVCDYPGPGDERACQGKSQPQPRGRFDLSLSLSRSSGARSRREGLNKGPINNPARPGAPEFRLHPPPRRATWSTLPPTLPQPGEWGEGASFVVVCF